MKQVRPSSPAPRATVVVVLGTGTAVGKTHFCLCLLAATQRAGLAAAGLKPIESGVGSGPSDASRLAAAGLFHVKQPPYALAAPVSPHLAARQAGVSIDLDRVSAWVSLHAAADLVVVETAGGACTPLGPGLTNLSLARALTPDAIVLVGVDRLGVLHDVTATQAALRASAPELPTPVVVLQSPLTPDASTGTNLPELLALSLVTEGWCLPRGEPAALASAPPVEALLSRLRRRQR